MANNRNRNNRNNRNNRINVNENMENANVEFARDTENDAIQAVRRQMEEDNNPADC
jgi:DNA replication protein DnaC